MAIPKIEGNFTDSLAVKISDTATSLTLNTSTDADGVTFSGVYYLTLDEGTSKEEHMIVTLAGAAGTIDTRGLSKVDAKTLKTANRFAHDRGAVVKMTNIILPRIINLLNGVETFDNKLSYTSVPTLTADVDIATKKYADDLAIAGAPDGTVTVKGIFEEATLVEIDADTATGGTSARLAVNPSTLATSKYGTRLPSADQKAALVGTSGTPSTSNKYVTNNDTEGTGNIVRTDKVKFGGDSTDSAVDGTAGITLTGSDNTYIKKDYTSWAAGSAARTVTVTPTGCVVHLKVRGNADLTNWTFDFDGKGGPGAAQAAIDASGVAGTSTSKLIAAAVAAGSGGTVSADSSIKGGGGGGGAASNEAAGTVGADSGATTGGAAGALNAASLPLANIQGRRAILIAPGAGGGSGGGGNSTSAVGGAGGAGGGCLIIEVLGNLTLDAGTTVMKANGANGSVGGATTAGGNNSGGGGGGAGGGGTIIVLYSGTLTGTITPTIAGGTGGAGGAKSGTGLAGGNGGNGGAGAQSIEKNEVFA